jgi:hypothetical protein
MATTEQHSRQLRRDIAFFVALMATAFALGGALAHALELPNKIGLAREDYFTVQQIYAGWNQLAYLLTVQVAGLVALAVVYWSQAAVVRPVGVAIGCLVAAQAFFWLWTFPANVATSNWTIQPENWEELRSQWEYSHLAGAVFQTGVMTALVVAVLGRRRGTDTAAREVRWNEARAAE